MASNLSLSKAGSRTARAPGSSPVLSRCTPRLARMRGFCGSSACAATGQRHGFVEPIIPRRHFARHAVDLTVLRRDRQGPRHLGVEIVLPILDVGETRDERTRLEAGRIHLERALQPFPGIVSLAGIDGFVRQKHVGVDAGRIDRERLFGGGDRFGRVVVRQGTRRTDERRHVAGIDLKRLAERLERFAVLVRFEPQLAPGGLNRGIAWVRRWSRRGRRHSTRKADRRRAARARRGPARSPRWRSSRWRRRDSRIAAASPFPSICRSRPNSSAASPVGARWADGRSSASAS